MTSQEHNSSSKSMLFPLFFTILLDVVVFLDIPVLRQIIAFSYVTFVPGILILSLLKTNEPDKIKRFLFAVGLSIACLMIVGLTVNFVYPFIGIAQPLSTIPLLLTLNLIVIVLCILVYVTKSPMPILEYKENLSTTLLILLLALLPVLCCLGAIFASTPLLLLSIVIFAVLFILCILEPKQLHLPSWFNIATLMVVSIGILLSTTMVSQYIHGPDVQLEYYLFRNTQVNGVWSPQTYYSDISYAKTNAMLSVTILPTIYSNLTGFDATFTFKLLFPLIYAFVPLGVFTLAKDFFGNKIAIIASFLFLSEFTFVLITGIGKEMIAEFFFILLFIVLLSNNKGSSKERLFYFVVFSFALVTAHYTMALVFLFLIFASWAIITITRRKNNTFKPTLLFLFFAIMFLWYIYIHWSAPFNSIVNFVTYTYSGLGDFFNPASRGSEVLRGIGLQATTSIWQLASSGIAYIVQFLIIFGAAALVFKKTERKANTEYISLAILSIVLLLLCIVLPRFALSLNMSRFYHITLFFLATSFAIGCEAFVTLVFKKKKLFSALAIIILATFLLFQTDFVYEVAQQESWSVPLSGYRMGIKPYTLEFCYVNTQDAYGAQWLSKNIDQTTMKLYADLPSILVVLASYGDFYRDIGGSLHALTNVTELSSGNTIFLNKMNVIDGVVINNQGDWNSSDIIDFMDETSIIYSNGGSEICRK